MAVLNIGRSDSYGQRVRRGMLTDTQLLAKEKRIEQREKRKADSKLYSAWCSVADFFLEPEYIDYEESQRLKRIHSGKKITDIYPNLPQPNKQINATNKTNQSIWTIPKKSDNNNKTNNK